MGAAGPVAGFSASPNVAATHSYLEAWYVWERAISVPASTIAVDAAASEVEADCPDVLVDAPAPASYTRAAKQLRDLDEELNFTVLGAWVRPEQQALTTLVSTVTRTHWTNRTLTRLLHAQVRHYADAFTGNVPALCDDMEAWAHSEYTKLDPGTEELVRRREAYQGLLRRSPEGLVTHLLARYENRSEKALARHLSALTETLNREAGPLETAKQRIEQTTGVHAPSV